MPGGVSRRRELSNRIAGHTRPDIAVIESVAFDPWHRVIVRGVDLGHGDGQRFHAQVGPHKGIGRIDVGVTAVVSAEGKTRGSLRDRVKGIFKAG
jgi:hypothetical protein